MALRNLRVTERPADDLDAIRVPDATADRLSWEFLWEWLKQHNRNEMYVVRMDDGSYSGEPHLFFNTRQYPYSPTTVHCGSYVVCNRDGYWHGYDPAAFVKKYLIRVSTS